MGTGVIGLERSAGSGSSMRGRGGVAEDTEGEETGYHECKDMDEQSSN